MKNNTKNENDIYVSGISLISSSVCNLQCSFCYLHKNESYKIYNEELQKAWKDGSYITNVKNSLIRLGADLTTIEEIQLWGGETLLTIDTVTPNVKTIYEYFPNVWNWRVSTNWMININNFFDFLKELDNTATTDEVLMQLQCSIDGPTGIYTEHGHNGKWEIYIKNFNTFFSLVNNYKFKKLKIRVAINSTVNKEDYLSSFSKKENIIQYVQYMSDFIDYLHSLCINRAIDIGNTCVFPGYAMPYDSTTEEGQQFAKILESWEEVRSQYFSYMAPTESFLYGVGEFNKPRLYFYDNPECSELHNNLTLMPDGQIVECSGAFMDHQKSYQDELLKEGKFIELKAAKARTHISANPLKMTDEELEEYKWYVITGYKGTQSTFLHMMASVCRELALSGQIPYKYYQDEDLLLKHLSSMSNLTSCTRENLKDTGIPYLTSASCFRRMMNGATEYAYNIKKIELENRIKTAKPKDIDNTLNCQPLEDWPQTNNSDPNNNFDNDFDNGPRCGPNNSTNLNK